MPRKCATGPQYGFSNLEAKHARIIFSQDDIERKLDHHDREFSAEFGTARDGRKPIPDEDGNIVMHHWSGENGLVQLDPAYMDKMRDGKTIGLRRENFRQGQPAIPFSSFGLNVGHPLGYKKENGLGSNEYIAKIPANRLYDIETDPRYFGVEVKRIAQEQNIPPMDTKSRQDLLSQLIRDAGYAGFFTPLGRGYGLVAAIWESMPVEQVKPRSDALAKSTASQYSNLIAGWTLTPGIIEAGRAQSPKNEFLQPKELEIMAKNKVENGINLDGDAEWARAVIMNNPIIPLGEVQEIPTFKKMIMALKNKATKGLIRKDGGPGYVKINDGEVVKTRLDIPAYTDTNTWIVTVHNRDNSVKGYAKSAVLQGVEFRQFSKASNNIAAGLKDKSPFATMRGIWVDVDAVEARRMANEALASNDWVEVGFNPQRYGYFYVKETGEKILSSPEVVQVGPLVMASTKDGFEFELPSGKQSFIEAPTVIEPTPHSALLAESMAFTKFNDRTDYIDTNNHDVILQERIPDLSKFPKMRGGGDRAVYRISEDKVVKVAKTKRGLAQNALANEYYLRNNEHWPRVFEIGKDYVIMEYVPRNDIAVNKFLKPLKAEGMFQGFKNMNRVLHPSLDNVKTNVSEFQEAMTELGLEQFMEFHLAWADFTAARNWGMKKDGTAVLVDEGAIDDLYLQSGYDADGQYQADWDRILERRRQIKKQQKFNRSRRDEESYASKVNRIRMHFDRLKQPTL